MALYFMSYDLRKDRDYDKLYDELDDFNAVRILESQGVLEGLKPQLKDFATISNNLLTMMTV